MTVILGPVLTGSPASKVVDKSTGRVLHKKQILPEGKYSYNGKELDLSADKLKTYVQSFKDKAFDEVPFQFGGSESEHNNDPLRRGGTLVHMEHIPGKGVNGYFDFSADPQTAAYVEKYPRFGVSPRIELDIERLDGKKFAGAIQHVCGTLVPRVNGMAPWEKVELSASANTSDTEVIDLSAETIDLEAPPVIDFLNDKPSLTQEGDAVAQITDEDLATLRQIREDNSLIEKLAGSMGQQMNQELSLSRGGEGGSGGGNAAPVDEEARRVAAATQKQVADLRRDLARSRWETQAQALVGAGVPPSAIELARPVMEDPDDHVIELSSGSSTTDKARTLALLEAMKGTIELGVESGHQVAGLTPSDEKDLEEWARSLGLGSGF
jgi:hypothetical protein